MNTERRLLLGISRSRDNDKQFQCVTYVQIAKLLGFSQTYLYDLLY